MQGSCWWEHRNYPTIVCQCDDVWLAEPQPNLPRPLEPSWAHNGTMFLSLPFLSNFSWLWYESDCSIYSHRWYGPIPYSPSLYRSFPSLPKMGKKNKRLGLHACQNWEELESVDLTIWHHARSWRIGHNNLWGGWHQNQLPFMKNTERDHISHLRVSLRLGMFLFCFVNSSLRFLISNLHPICTCSCLFTPLTEGRSARDLTQAATSQKNHWSRLSLI